MCEGCELVIPVLVFLKSAAMFCLWKIVCHIFVCLFFLMLFFCCCFARRQFPGFRFIRTPSAALSAGVCQVSGDLFRPGLTDSTDVIHNTELHFLVL